LVLISGIHPQHTSIFFGIALCISLFAANQDIAIDAWRIAFLKAHEQGIGIAASVNGFHAGKLIASAGVMVIAEYHSWSFAYFCMALLMLLGLLSSFWIGLRENQCQSTEDKAFHFDFKKHIQLLWYGFQDLFKQQSIWLILFFIISFKLGDALLDAMLLIFLDDIGFSKLELAFANKTWGTINNIIGVIFGGILVHRLGVLSALVYSGILQILSNLVFCFQAQAGHDLNTLYFSISIEKLSGGLATTAFVAYISTLCKQEYAAVQYSMLTALASVLRTSIQAFSGIFVVYCEAVSFRLIEGYQLLASQNIQTIKWILYFVLTTLCALPSMLMLYGIQRRQKH
jgi:PAT family beta-lactamase induction signal transducer AmpG